MTVKKLAVEEIARLLDVYLETEFTFIRTESMVSEVCHLAAADQRFILELVQRIATTNIEVAHQLVCRAKLALSIMEPQVIQEWALHAADCYDSQGLAQALAVIRTPHEFLRTAHERVHGARLEENKGVLHSFLQGLSGRRLQIAEADLNWTDGETIYLPKVLAYASDRETNFSLYKAMLVHEWAQTRYGTLRPELSQICATFPSSELALQLYHAFETVRLDACIARELPGLHRQMELLASVQLDAHWPKELLPICGSLAHEEATFEHSLKAMKDWYGRCTPPVRCYQGLIFPVEVERIRAERIEREKVLIRVRLAQILEQLQKEGRKRRQDDHFELPSHKANPQSEVEINELLLDGRPLQPPDMVRDMLTSVLLDFGEIPPEYLHPAGPAEYRDSRFLRAQASTEEVWSGTYHEEGAFLYSEWDCKRRHYRKNWCVVREHTLQGDEDGYYQQVLQRYSVAVHQIRRTFELLRGEDQLLRGQPLGEEVDIDAFVQGYADMLSGMELTDRLYTQLARHDRNMAVLLMVDLSGSTKGWINDAEREALVLLTQALEILGDRYAIYGFSGWGRKRCEVFRVKGFEEALDDQVKGRISALAPRDYTRMGPAIRHLSHLLDQMNAKVKLLITISDGKPDDYDAEYRGSYGIEDTRMALMEAHRIGIHPYCITIDRHGQDYLPHMYGAANYTVIDEVDMLPLRIADIYRKITS